VAVSLIDDKLSNFGVTGKFERLLRKGVCAQTEGTGTCVREQKANTKSLSQITL